MLGAWPCAFCVLCVLIESCAAQETCYPPGGVAGIVVATIIVTFVVGGLGAAVAYKLWTRKKGRKTRDGQHPKQSQRPNEFAFDNPYFRDPEANDGDRPDKGKERSSINNKNSLRSSKLSELSSKGKKPRSGKNHFMFGGGGGKKHRALDDSCLCVEPERTIVSLRGHDFTGLGFNICGNMRDGILVKDVLHRGPASESGLIKAGDKIVNVTVSFTNIVYEDALTILSYASPYDVQLEIERVPEKSRTPSGSKRLGSCSFNNSGQKLFHPLYRSQSIDDLTQIDKDTFPSHGPRRSQSVGVAAHKLAAHFKNSDSKLEDRSAGSLMLSTTGSLNEKMLANVMADGNVHKNGLQWEKRFEDTLESEDSASNNDAHSTGILKVSDDPAHCIQNYKQYLDSPHQRGKLEAFKSSGGEASENLKSGRAKTMAEASNALWHLDQSIKEGDVSITEFEGSRSAPWSRSKRDGDDESDVSNDSLETTSKKRGNKKGKKPSEALKEEAKISGHKQKASKKGAQPGDTKFKGKAEMGARSEYSERVYANNIMNKSASSLHNTSSAIQGADSHLREAKQHKQANHRDIQDDARNTQKILIDDSSNSCGRNAYGERQKLSSSENYSQNYGCTNRITINGESDEPKSKLPLVHKNASPDEIDTDTRYLDKNKFTKKSAHPAGMFTQINPFQQPSRQKNASFKIWTGREESPVNGDSNRRESQNYGHVAKTILISSFHDTTSGGAQNSPLNYRPQHK